MRPFEGIRIIDITHVLAGPFAAYQLALLGAECAAGAPAPAGFECACAGDGKTRFRSVGGFGLGSRALAFRDLNKCLLNAQNPMDIALKDAEKSRYSFLKGKPLRVAKLLDSQRLEQHDNIDVVTFVSTPWRCGWPRGWRRRCLEGRGRWAR